MTSDDYIRTYITHEDITGSKANYSDIIRILSQLNIYEVISLLSVIMPALTGADHNNISNNRLQKSLIDTLLPDYKDNIFAFVKQNKTDLLLFHRHQFLLFLKLSIESCPQNNGLTRVTSAQGNSQFLTEFGKALFMVNDLFSQNSKIDDSLPSSQQPFQLASMMIPIAEMSYGQQALPVIGRANEIWLNIPNKLQKSSNYVSFEKPFLECTGVSLEYFIKFLTLLFVRSESYSPHSIERSDPLIVNEDLFLTNTTSPKDIFKMCLAVISRDINDLSTLLFSKGHHSRINDMTILRMTPVISIDKNHVIYDRGFLYQSFFDIIYWTINDHLSDPEKVNFRAFFGEIVEEYAYSILEHTSEQYLKSKSQIVYKNPKFKDNAEVCDILLECNDGEFLILIEVKASILTTQAKYSGDPNILHKDVVDRFIGKPKSRKGISQLSDSINKLINGQPIVNYQIDIKKCRGIYPVIVTYDPSIMSPGILGYLQSEFGKQIAMSDSLSTPPVHSITVMSIDDIEAYSTFSKNLQFNHLLAQYRHFRTSNEIGINFYISNHLKKEIKDGNYLLENFRRSIETIKSEFFDQE
ncbi:MAG: hypothetical protein QM758_00900 [Armatimonas sp.]